MGFLKNMFKELEKQIDTIEEPEKNKSSRRQSGGKATRWEKACVALDGVVKQVVKVDPNGIDIVCFGGDEDPVWHRNIKSTKGVEELVNEEKPSGACRMGAAMEECIEDAFDKDLTKRPVAIMVITAGKPNDADALDAALMAAVTRIADSCSTCPLSVTFVQIGDDRGATEYLAHLDNYAQAECSATGETFDLVDTIKDEDIQKTMSEIKGTKDSGKNGAIIGAFAGAAMGVGGMYLHNKQQAKKRTEGWGGKWKVTYDGEEISILDIKDDQNGNLTIEGFPSGEPTTGSYSTEDDDFDDEEYTISFKDPAGDWEIEGTVEDEHAITWSDGTRWDEIPQEGASFGQMAGAAAGGAAVAGATGYMLDKHFFKRACKKDQCEYIILLDRSSKMRAMDTY